MVLLPGGIGLAAEPGGEPAVRPGTNLGLVLERRDGQTRLVAGDGTQGWTGTALPAPAPVTVECPQENFTLFRESPDAVSPESGETVKATAGDGPLLGAATKTYPASQQQLLAPSRLRVLLPVVRVRCGVEGYAPLDWMWLRYSAPALADVQGLVRRPFLGPFRQALQDAAPAAGSRATVFLQDKVESRPLGQRIAEVHGFYRNPAASGQTLTIYGSGTARLYRFSEPELNLLLPEYAPYPLRVEVHEGEWLVEVVSIFGDGAYSTLFRIRRDGSVTFQPLSRSSGEEAGDAEASWGWLNGQVWVARLAEGKVRLSGFRQLWLAEAADPLEPGAALFPERSGAETRWIAAVPFASEQAAGGRAVRRYP